MTRRAKEQRQKRLAQRLAAETPEEIERRLKWQALLDGLDAAADAPPAVEPTEATAKARARTLSAPDVLSWKSSHAIVAASGRFELPVRVEYEDSELSYEFHTKEMDIVFSIAFLEAATGLERFLISPTRCASHESAVKGVHEVRGPGLLTLTWDNEFSWINQKELSYNVELHQSVPHLQAPVPAMPTAKDVLQKELAIRQATWREKADALATLQVGVDERRARIAALEQQLASIQLDLAATMEAQRVATTELQGVSREVDVLEGEMTALAWRTLPPPLASHVLSFGSKADWKQWMLINKKWARIIAGFKPVETSA
ncbi:F-box protein [Achlya hypogyna]|uniref:F-box protein n=1 Tax=Achlya hypogyna TaxID=1202772 RepID=A0A1V9ZRQ3_ACHHY|nr:F-box protein [Achlya hypogyna]